MSDMTWWADEVRPEWQGHSWAALRRHGVPSLVAEAAVWADEPSRVLYVRADSLSAAYGFAVAVAQRAGQRLRQHAVGADASLLFAVGLLDELSVPADPDPARTDRMKEKHLLWSAEDTREGFLHHYADRLRRATLTLLRLPARWDAGDATLDMVADGRLSKPTIVAGTVPPHQIAEVYADRVAWRLGFGDEYGQIGHADPDAAVLDLNNSPR
jgi:hypothetical protein